MVDCQSHKIVRLVGPFGSSIRPFTVNANKTLCLVNVNGLLGFEIGDLKSGKVLHRVEVAGAPKGTAKRLSSDQPLRSWRMMTRPFGVRRASSRKPAAAKVDNKPV